MNHIFWKSLLFYLIGSTPWKINQEVLDLVIKLFTNQSEYRCILNDLSISMEPKLVMEPEMDDSIKGYTYKVG